jgi:dolichyl-phosphate-mannose--protein O-mannosyl transferase
LAQFAILAGLLILLGGVAVTVRTSGTTTQLVVGGLSALGTTISAYVGATSIRMYNRALSQMNFYYAQPLVQSYVLQAEHLSQSLRPGRKDAVLEKIITQTLEGASVASHLIARAGDTPSGLFRADGLRKEDKESEAGKDSTDSHR